jgi:hypothetical protein
MIVQLSPKYKFVCDRCGKEIFPDSEGGFPGVHHVAFLKDTDFLYGDKKKSGDICDECHKEFVEIADNFFDETNKEEAEKALTEREGKE